MISRRQVIFVGCALTLGVASASVTSPSVAFPDMTKSLNASLVLLGWVLSANQIVGISALPLAGKANDTLGRKRGFTLSLSLFTAGSLLCALASNVSC